MTAPKSSLAKFMFSLSPAILMMIAMLIGTVFQQKGCADEPKSPQAVQAAKQRLEQVKQQCNTLCDRMDKRVAENTQAIKDIVNALAEVHKIEAEYKAIRSKQNSSSELMELAKQYNKSLLDLAFANGIYSLETEDLQIAVNDQIATLYVPDVKDEIEKSSDPVWARFPNSLNAMLDPLKQADTRLKRYVVYANRQVKADKLEGERDRAKINEAVDKACLQILEYRFNNPAAEK